MESSLELLTEAANFVENQGRNGFEQRRVETSPQPPAPPHPGQGRAPKENGGPGHTNSAYHPRHTPVEEPKHAKDVRNVVHLTKPMADELHRASAASSKPENMRLNDRSSGDETAMANYNHSNGVLHQRMYQDERHLLASYRNCSTESPTRSLSPVAKRPLSPSNAADGDHGQRTMVLPHALTSLPSVAGHPIGHFAPHNPMLSFLHPYMLPATLDPSIAAETLARQQGLALAGEVERQQQQSPGSSPNAASSSAGITAAAAAAALPGFMYPLAANPAYFMGARGSQTPGLSLADIPMLFPSQIAAYGANMLPGQVPAFGALSEQDKRLYESLPAFAQHTPAHLLAHPYFKSFCAPTAASSASGIDAAAAKDAAAAAAAAGVAMPGFPSVDFLLKYQEALASEAIKKGILSPQQTAPSPTPRRSSSPEPPKKAPMVAQYPFSVPFPPAYLTNPTALSKSPVPERKVSTPTLGPIKNGTGVPAPHHQQQHQEAAAAAAARATREQRDLLYAGSNDLLAVNGDEARRRLMALAQRPRNPAELYASPYKGPHDRTDRRTPSPYNDRRRISRERSPSRSMSADKSGKKRSHESTFVPEVKSRSPAQPHHIDGNRVTKSPHRRSTSPMSRLGSRHSHTTNPYLPVGGNKANPDKENPPYLTQTPPYVFPQTIGGFPGPPYALQSYLRQADPSASSVVKSSMAGLATPAFSTAQASQLYRAPAPADAAALAEYLRLAGVSPYAVLMPQQQQQQQQSLRHSVIAHANPTTQGLLDKERGSPAVNPLLVANRSQAHGVKLPCDSPAPHQPQSSSHGGAGGKTAKLSYSGPPYTYTPYGKSRTPPGYQEVPVKREVASPPSGRRVSNLPAYGGAGKVGGGAVRSSDDERANRLKRKVDEEHEHPVGKDMGVKHRKREVNADASADIDEHFRRSLGDQYKKEVEPPALPPSQQQQQIVNITSTVDDHFQKALGGDVWSRLKPNTKSTSPEALDVLDRRDIPTFRGETAHGTPHAAAMHPSMYLAVQGDRHLLTYAQSGKAPPNGNKTVKARGIVYPEAPPTESASRTYSNNSSSGRSDRSSPPPGKLDIGYTNAFVPESKARIAAYQASTQSALNCRSTQSPVKSHAESYSEHEGARRPGASPGSKQPPPYTVAPTSYGGSPTAVAPAYSPQSSSSTSKSSPTRQPPSDGQSPTDLQDHHLQSMERAKTLYRPGLEAQQ